MTRKLAISVPDDVAERLDRESNVSAFIVDSVRRRMASESTRRTLAEAGFTIDEERIEATRRRLDELQSAITPDLRVRAAELKTRIDRGRPW
jgi:hypothetical protein